MSRLCGAGFSLWGLVGRRGGLDGTKPQAEACATYSFARVVSPSGAFELLARELQAKPDALTLENRAPCETLARGGCAGSSPRATIRRMSFRGEGRKKSDRSQTRLAPEV